MILIDLVGDLVLPVNSGLLKWALSDPHFQDMCKNHPLPKERVVITERMKTEIAREGAPFRYKPVDRLAASRCAASGFGSCGLGSMPLKEMYPRHTPQKNSKPTGGRGEFLPYAFPPR